MGFSSYNYGIFSVAQFSRAFVAKQTSKKITSVSIDSRKVQIGSLFVCLKGKRTDGHAFIEKAISKGASAIMVESSFANLALSLTKNTTTGVLVVENPLYGLQELAKNYIAQFPLVNYSGITGSCGKSTTKQALAALLSTCGKTVYTPGNYNSEIGLPISLLQVDCSVKYGIFEMGIDHKGEMDRHLYMVKPNQSLITNIGQSHLEKLGSSKNIAKEKGKIFHSNLDLGFISNSCKYKNYLKRRTFCKIHDYSNRDFTYISRGLLGYDVEIGNELVRIPILGEHQLEDIAGAVKVATILGLSNENIAEGLRAFKPLVGRGSIVDGSITVIEDCYNASPTSTSCMLGYLGNVDWKGSKKVVLGSMKELGKDSKKGHTLVAKSVYKSKVSSAFLFGKEMEGAYNYLKEENYKGKLFYSDNFDEINYAVDNDKENGDLFLLKGSRVMEVERLIPTLQGAQ